MKKRTNILFYLGITFFLLTGCDKESAAPPLSGERDVEVRLGASVSNIEVSVTRAIIKNNLLERAEVGVFGTVNKDGTFANPYLNNLKYLYAGGINGNLLIQPIGTVVKYPPGQDKLYLYGYYPYTANVVTDQSGNATISVTGTKGNSDVTDYLYTGTVIGSKAQAVEGNHVLLQLKHALAILRFNLYTEAKEYTIFSHPVLNSITFVTREEQEGSMNLRTGVITSKSADNASPATLNYSGENLGIIAGIPAIIKEYLLFPYESAENSAIRKLTLNVSIPGETGTKDIVVFDEANTDENQNKVIVKLKAGHITTINIKYSQSMAAKASVNEWKNGDEHTFE